MGGALSPATCLPWCALAAVFSCLAGRLVCVCWPPAESGRRQAALQPLVAATQPPVAALSED